MFIFNKARHFICQTSNLMSKNWCAWCINAKREPKRDLCIFVLLFIISQLSAAKVLLTLLHIPYFMESAIDPYLFVIFLIFRNNNKFLARKQNLTLVWSPGEYLFLILVHSQYITYNWICCYPSGNFLFLFCSCDNIAWYWYVWITEFYIGLLSASTSEISFL